MFHLTFYLTLWSLWNEVVSLWIRQDCTLSRVILLWQSPILVTVLSWRCCKTQRYKVSSLNLLITNTDKWIINIQLFYNILIYFDSQIYTVQMQNLCVITWLDICSLTLLKQKTNAYIVMYLWPYCNYKLYIQISRHLPIKEKLILFKN